MIPHRDHVPEASSVVANHFEKQFVLLLSANNSELVEHLEGVVSAWTNQIKQVLTESEQMRKEADDVGPSAELEHWKRHMVTFNRWNAFFESTNDLSSQGRKQRVLLTVHHLY